MNAHLCTYTHKHKFLSFSSHARGHMRRATHQHIPLHKSTFKHTLTALSSHTLTHWFGLKDMHVTHAHIQPCTKQRHMCKYPATVLYGGAFWQGLHASQSNASAKIHCLSKHPIHQLPFQYSWSQNAFWCILLWMAQRLWKRGVVLSLWKQPVVYAGPKGWSVESRQVFGAAVCVLTGKATIQHARMPVAN